MVLFVLFSGCSKQVGARPKEVKLLPLFSGTEDTSRITTITKITNVTQAEVNRDAEAPKEMASDGSSPSQEEVTNSKKIMTRFPTKGVKRNICIKRVFYRVIYNYIITKSMRALWLVNQPWVIVPVNPRKNRASSELLYKSNRPQVSMGYRLINHLGCW